MLIVCGVGLEFRFLDRLVNSLVEKKHHEIKLKEGLKDLAIKRMELQNSLSSLWPKQVSTNCHLLDLYLMSIYSKEIA